MSKKPQVLFINPPSIPYNYLVKGLSNQHSALSQTISMPMGILYLSSVLQRDFPEIEIKIIDLAKSIRNYANAPNREPTDWLSYVWKVLNEEISDDFQPDFIGISILFSTADKSSVYVADVVKSKWPTKPIVMGGMHATNAVNSLLSHPNIDYICRGEGESVISLFLEKLINNGDPELIEGIIGLKKLRSQQLDSAPLINDLDEIPFPAWDLLDMPAYTFSNTSRARHFDIIEQDGEATIITTRGCPFLCTFCASWTVHGRKMRYRSINNVLEELRTLSDVYNVSSVIPEDDLFTVKKKRIIGLCTRIYEEFKGKLHFQFPNGLSVATLDKEVIQALVKMGMSVANIAIESGSNYVQKNIIEKKCNLKRAISVVQDCRDTGIMTRTYFIMGFPGETREHMQETIDYMLTLPTDWNVINQAAPLIGTKMYDQLLIRGDIDHTYNWDTSFFQERSFDTPEIEADELKNLVYDTNITMNFFNNYNLRTGDYYRAIKLWKDILHAYSNHLVAQYCTALAYKEAKRFDEYNIGLDNCRLMMKADDNEMAQYQFNRYKDNMPELKDLQLSKDVIIAMDGPRPGMPNEAKKQI